MSAPGPAPAEIRERLIGPGGAFELVEEIVRGHSMRVFKQRTRSLRELLERTERFGDRLYLVDGDVRLTFHDHLEQVARAANALRERHGIRPGDRVALFAANRWEWIVAFWATSWLGAIPCLMNGWWTAEEFAELTLVDSRQLLQLVERQAAGFAFSLQHLTDAVKHYRFFGLHFFRPANQVRFFSFEFLQFTFPDFSLLGSERDECASGFFHVDTPIRFRTR